MKAIGNSVVSDSTTEERLKVEKRLHALETRFYGLEKTSRARMSELQVQYCTGSDGVHVLYYLFLSLPRMPTLRLVYMSLIALLWLSLLVLLKRRQLHSRPLQLDHSH